MVFDILKLKETFSRCCKITDRVLGKEISILDSSENGIDLKSEPAVFGIRQMHREVMFDFFFPHNASFAWKEIKNKIQDLKTNTTFKTLSISHFCFCQITRLSFGLLTKNSIHNRNRSVTGRSSRH